MGTRSIGGLACFLIAAAAASLVAAELGGESRGQPVAVKPSLSLEGARRVIAAASDEAKRHGCAGAIAVVDEGGHLIALERLEGTFPAGAEIAIGKARTAALFRRPTKAFEDIIAKGRTAMVALDDFTPLEGGVPIVVDGQVAGAVGVSGAASAQVDESMAQAGASAIAAKLAGQESAPAQASGAAAPVPAAVTHIGAGDVALAFAKGQPLLEVPSYKVHASRREGPGKAEVHETDTDVIYFVEGSATLVTGGELVAGERTAGGELRGAAIRGGVPRKVTRGDVVVVPSGVPHWFQEVPAPLVYYVVKVATGAKLGGAR